MMNEQGRNPRMAVVLSFIFNGLGQLYNGQIIKGMVIVFISTLSILIFIAGSILIAFWMLSRVLFEKQLVWGLVLFCIGLVFICVLGIYSIFDAYRVALKK